MKTILLKFCGPMQSWGTSSHFEVRNTDLYPSKSAVIGLIGSALGYCRNDDAKFHELNQLKFAVRIDQGGDLYRDYQNVHEYDCEDSIFYPEYIKNHQTERYYLTDAVFVAALSGDDTLIEKIKKALLHPCHYLFMGRRNCPVPPDLVIGVRDTDDVIKALEEERWHADDWYVKKCKKRSLPCERLVVHADATPGDSNCTIRRDIIKSLSTDGRQYVWRRERTLSIKNPGNDHDAFELLEG